MKMQKKKMLNGKLHKLKLKGYKTRFQSSLSRLLVNQHELHEKKVLNLILKNKKEFKKKKQEKDQ